MDTLRHLFEAWLFKATERPLPAWQRSLLAWALERDEALRMLALELAEFQHGEAPAEEQAPDLRARLLARVESDRTPVQDAPLFPSAWVPAGAIGLLLVIACTALLMRPERGERPENSSAQAGAAAQDLVAPTATPTQAPIPTATPNQMVGDASPTAETPQALSPAAAAQ